MFIFMKNGPLIVYRHFINNSMQRSETLRIKNCLQIIVDNINTILLYFAIEQFYYMVSSINLTCLNFIPFDREMKAPQTDI